MNRIMGQGRVYMVLRANELMKRRDAEIDARVAHFYNLSEEEHSLILSELKPPDPFRITALNCYRDIARGQIKGNN